MFGKKSFSQHRAGPGFAGQCSASSIRDNSGELIGILLICQDRTMVRELQAEIRRRKTKERQLEYLSHDPDRAL